MIAARMVASAWSPTVGRLREPGTVVAAMVLLTVALAGLLAPWSGYLPGTDVDPTHAAAGPSAAAWLARSGAGRARAVCFESPRFPPEGNVEREPVWISEQSFGPFKRSRPIRLQDSFLTV